MGTPQAPLTYGDAELLLPLWKPDDFVLLKDLAEGVIRVDPFDLMRVLVLESQMDPHARNPVDPKKYPVAVGLNQITAIAALEAKLIPSLDKWRPFADELMLMTVPMQLYVVARYFSGVPWGRLGKPYNATLLYQSNFMPYTLPGKTAPGDVLTVKGEKTYDNNSGLDVSPKDGKITVKDLSAAMSGVPYAERTKPFWEASVFMYKYANKLA